MRQDLRTFLQDLATKRPQQLKVVEAEVDPVFEAAAIVERLRTDSSYPTFPAVLFKTIKGSQLPLLMNLHGTFERIALSIDSDVQHMVPDYAAREGSPIPTTLVSSDEAPVHEMVLTGDDADVTRLPTLVHQELDAGRYITSAVTISRDPEGGLQNAGIFRHQVQGPSQVGFMTNPAHHTAYILRSYRERSESMEVALVIGHHPAMLLAGASKLAGIGGELEVMGGLLGESVEVVQAKTVDLQVPARAEIVIEGVVDTNPEKVREEGPFGEYPLYYTGLGKFPWVEVRAITMRKEPIYVDVFNAHPEHLVLGSVPWMGSIYRRVREAVPTVTAVNLPSMGALSTLFISMKKRVEGEAKIAACAALAVVPLLKHVYVVDDDIDVFDHDQVMWAVATRFQADRDLTVMPNFLGGHLNPVTYGLNRNEKGPMETKLIFDCTRPAPPAYFPPKCQIPPEIVNRVELASLVTDYQPDGAAERQTLDAEPAE